MRIHSDLRFPAAAALLTPLLFLAPHAGRAQNQPPAAATPAEAAAASAPITRFDGSAKFQAKGGQSRDVHATIHQWVISPKQKVDIAEKGFLLVTVRAGKVNVTVGGKTEQHRTDDMWSVPDNTKMSVEAPGEAAVLEVIAFTVR